MDQHTFLLFIIVAGVTILLRFLPFMIFNGKRQIPSYILYLGNVLPYAIMGMLIIYCLRSVTFSSLGEWLPSLIGVVVVVVLHLWKRNTLISIMGGTLVYMFLVQVVF